MYRILSIACALLAIGSLIYLGCDWIRSASPMAAAPVMKPLPKDSAPSGIIVVDAEQNLGICSPGKQAVTFHIEN
ncbi:MAG TPA: hypothetical protein VGL71_02075, partial [Urbifossiella sp.]